MLDQARGVHKIVEKDLFAEADCTLGRIEQDRGATQTLWIDNATHLVRMDVFEHGSQRESLFSVAALGEKVDVGLFVYDPDATHAANRRELSRQAPESLKGKSAPDFTLRDLERRQVRLSDLRGPIVLLDFCGNSRGKCCPTSN